MKRLIIGLIVTLVCAGIGGAAAWWVASSGLPAEVDTTTERARLAADGLSESHVYVDPSVEGMFSDEQIARIDEAANTSDPEVFVVVWPESRQAGYGPSSDVLRQIGRLLDRPGVYVQVSPGDALDSVDVGIDGEYFSIYESPAEEWSSSRETTLLLDKIAENDGREYELGEDTGSDYWGGTAGTIGAGALIGSFGGGLVGTIALVGWFIMRRRRAGV
ncbi:hypothetical protein [Phytoactinopolyspora halotolerans]|uniref:TPM domain-containing protein n=1 Tax=Phytoactinopolyspora halotolerans TaxID=1981512 RepID=A0A6L9SEE4_9ACTN|nr:hypothetical protein [Phytoactinopolyspora halotolerans]NEE02430.1 hypothetical protein [Phytoactinopolyspora halotolerans]